LVEDNREDALVFQIALEQAAVPVKITRIDCGEKAIKYFTDNKVSARSDLVLLDLSLPRVDGLEVLETIRAREELKSLPVIVMSGSNDPTEIERCYRAGANSYLYKSARLEEMLFMIKHFAVYWFQCVRLPSNP
jgi:CheY-like chemotaxis protein